MSVFRLIAPAATRALVILVLAAGSVWADERAVTVDLGVGAWKYDFDGTIATDPTGVDLQIDFGLGDDTDQQYFIDVSFAQRWMPNLRFEHSTVVGTGARDLGRDVVFGGISFPAPAGLRSRLTYQDNHLTAYFPVLKQGDLTVDLGLGVKRAESGFRVNSTFNQIETAFDETLPMVFLGVDVQLLSGWSINARTHALFWGDQQVIDGSATLSWESPWRLGLQMGYRHVQFQLEETGDYSATDFEILGPFASVTYRF
ncbi:MAG: TIGR04219 family outer membrane beta-barrel protein [Pseudomonadota bacterium]